MRIAKTVNDASVESANIRRRMPVVMKTINVTGGTVISSRAFASMIRRMVQLTGVKHRHTMRPWTPPARMMADGTRMPKPLNLKKILALLLTAGRWTVDGSPNALSPVIVRKDIIATR
jgi:hypothetical protein